MYHLQVMPGADKRPPILVLCLDVCLYKQKGIDHNRFVGLAQWVSQYPLYMMEIVGNGRLSHNEIVSLYNFHK